MEFNFFAKFKVKRQHHFPYFAHISDLKKKNDFSENPVNLDMGI